MCASATILHRLPLSHCTLSLSLYLPTYLHLFRCNSLSHSFTFWLLVGFFTRYNCTRVDDIGIHMHTCSRMSGEWARARPTIQTKTVGKSEWASTLRGCWYMSITAQLGQDNGIYILNIVSNSNSEWCGARMCAWAFWIFVMCGTEIERSREIESEWEFPEPSHINYFYMHQMY